MAHDFSGLKTIGQWTDFVVNLGRILVRDENASSTWEIACCTNQRTVAYRIGAFMRAKPEQVAEAKYLLTKSSDEVERHFMNRMRWKPSGPDSGSPTITAVAESVKGEAGHDCRPADEMAVRFLERVKTGRSGPDDDLIAECFSGTNFGGLEKSPDGRKRPLAECVLKCFAHYSSGSTICDICEKLGLINASGVTRLGARWLYHNLCP